MNRIVHRLLGQSRRSAVGGRVQARPGFVGARRAWPWPRRTLVWLLLVTLLSASSGLSPGHAGAVTPDVASTNRYVATTGSGGSDTGNGCTSPSLPCATIGHAVCVADSGDVISVAAGTYDEHVSIPSSGPTGGLPCTASLTALVVEGGFNSAFTAQAGATIVDGTNNGTVFTISSGVSVTLAGLTVQHGFAAGDGGGIANSGTATLSNVTLSGNTAGSGDGGGIFNDGTATLQGTILAGNSGGDCANFGTLTSQGYNLDADGTCGLTGTGDQSPSSSPSANANLGPLASNGGPTQTIALLPGSTAIDADKATSCPSACPTMDQRGVTRGAVGGSDVGFDSGAFETTQVSGVTVGVNPPAAGQSAIYTVGLTTSQPYGTLGSGATIVLTAPTGTSFPSFSASPPANYSISVNNGHAAAVSRVAVTGGNQAALTLGSSTIAAGDTVTLTVSGVTNPAAGASYTLSVTTSADAEAAASAAYSILPATTTAVTSSANPSVFGQTVSFTATVSSTGGTPTGTVQFVIDGSNAGTPVALNSSGQVTFVISSLSVAGSPHSVAGNYNATGNFANSSGTLTPGQTVNKASTATSVASSLNPSTAGQSVTFTATVCVSAPGSGAIPTTDTVQFKVDGSSAGSPVTLSTVASACGGTGGGQATYQTSSLAAGSHTVEGDYSGDSSFAPSVGLLAGGQQVNAVSGGGGGGGGGIVQPLGTPTATPTPTATAVPTATTTPGGSPTPTATPGCATVTYAAGYNLAGGPLGTLLKGAAGSLFTFQSSDSAYESFSPGTALSGGIGVWAFFFTPATVTLPCVTGTTQQIALPANHFIMVGNPFDRPATLTGAPVVDTFNPTTNTYTTATGTVTLGVGQGAWVFSSSGGTLTMTST